MEYFLFVISNTAEAWIYCCSRSDSNMLWVWFICSLYVSSERGVKLVAKQEICTKNKKYFHAQPFSSFRSGHLALSNNLCLSTLHFFSYVDV
jgi:hypothetical protein